MTWVPRVSELMRAGARDALLRAGRHPLGGRVLNLYGQSGLLDSHRCQDGSGGGLSGNKGGALVVAERVALLEEMWNRVLPRMPAPEFDDVTEQYVDDDVPPLDRPGVDLTLLSVDQRQWWEQGFLVKERLVSDEVLDAYWEVRSQLDDPGGWNHGAPYLEVPEVLDLSVYKPLTELLEQLIGEPMAVNLNLTGTVSTERNWHQDDFLNYPGTKSWYAAVWFAVGDIDPDSGPFQYVPGSHRWPAIRRDRVKLFLSPDERDSDHWPKLSERFLSEMLEREIERRSGEVRTFIGKKGDVLIWHGRLVHRGSAPAVPGTLRRSFISHYTGLNHWAMGPNVGKHANGSLYFLQ